MEKDLIIDVNSSEISIALLDNHRLVELNKEQNNGSYSVGDVYLGKVKKIMPALNAAFVDIGDDKDAFIGIITRSAIMKYCYERLFPED